MNFHLDIVGKPFFEQVIAELEKRKRDNINRNFTSSVLSYKPYINLKAISSIEYEKDNSPKIVYSNGKFKELSGTPPKQGFKRYEEQSGLPFSGNVTISDVQIDITDYVLFSVKVDFVIANAIDFPDFKNMWLKFGKDVELSWGRMDGDVNRNNKLSPNHEKMYGKIVYFDYKSNSNRSITGTLTMYSMAFLMQIMKQKSSFLNEEIELRKSKFREMILNDVMVTGEEWKKEQEEKSSNDVFDYSIAYTKRIRVGSDIPPTPAVRVPFSGVMVGNGFRKYPRGTIKMPNDFKRRFGNSDTNTLDTTISRRKYTEAQIKLGKLNKVLENIQGGIKYLEDINLRYNRDKENDDDYREDFVDYVKKNNIQRYKLYKLISSRSTRWFYKKDISMILKTYEDGWTLELFSENFVRVAGQEYPYYGINATDDNKTISIYNMLSELREIVNGEISKLSVLVQKYQSEQTSSNGKDGLISYKKILSNLILDGQLYYSYAYYFLSMSFLEKFINEELRFYHGGNVGKKDVSKLLNINITDVPINSNFPNEYKSKYPYLCLINPNNRKYKYNRNSEQYELSDSGDYHLLKDVYISVVQLYDLLEESKSIYDFLENVIKLVNECSNNNIMLKKSLEYSTNTEGDSTYTSNHTMTVFDSSFISSMGDGGNSTKYYTFSLFDPSERVEMEVNTDIPDDMSYISYFKQTGNIVDDQGTTFDSDGQVNTALDLELDNTSGLNTQNNNNLVKNMLIKAYMDSHKITKTFFSRSNLSKPVMTSIMWDLSYISVYYDVLSKYVKSTNSNTDENTSIEIPLKLSLNFPFGIAKIYAGQVFRVNNDSYPIGYKFSENESLSHFVIMNVSHQINSSGWSTTLEAKLFVSKSGIDLMKGEISGYNDYKTQYNNFLKSLLNEYTKLITDSMLEREE